MTKIRRFTIKITKAINIKDEQVAVAAPNIPKWGINVKFRTTFDMAPKPLIQAIQLDFSIKYTPGNCNRYAA